MPETKSKNNTYYAIAGAVVVIMIIIVALLSLGVLSFSQSTVVAGDNVSVYYIGSFTNGTVFGENFNSTPLNFTAGSNQLISGFSNAVIGMKVGQIKNVTLTPNEAYGYPNSSDVVKVPISDFGNSTIKANEIVTSANGQQGVIESISSNSVVINLNSPLAGKTLRFEIKLLAIKK
jgi:FKBP-type peptidyl-prolyl cis-trans isomerase 2